MTANQVQIRRDTSGNLATSTPAAGEAGYDTTNKRLIVGDGSSLGGIPHVNYLDHINNVFSHVSAGGTGNAITLTLTKAPAAYTQGMELIFKATAGNTGATTVNVNSLGVKNIQKISSGALAALANGDIVSGGMYKVIYDGAQFQLISLQSSGITSVKQGDLNSSTGIVSNATGGGVVHYTLPGGEYGFYPQLRHSGSSFINGFAALTIGANGSAQAIADTKTALGLTTSYASRISLYNSNATSTMYAQQRYINSSPPFDLGDGDAAGFFYALVNSSGDIVGHYSADVPPWAYNGPTSIRCDWQCPQTQKKFRRVKEPRTVEEIMDGAQAVYKMEEITMQIKNADMGLIPHPFSGFESSLIPVLIDPMDERLARLIESQNTGDDSFSTAITSGKIKIDNDCMKNRKGPVGCPIHRMKFKYSGGKK